MLLPGVFRSEDAARMRLSPVLKDMFRHLFALFARGYLPIVKTSDRPMLPRPARLRTLSPPCPTPRETLPTFAGSSVASWVVSPLMLAWASKRYLPAGKG